MIHRERDRVRQIIELGKKLPLENTEIIGHWGRYACVTTTGYIEAAFRILLQTHVQAKSAPEVATYVKRDLDGVQNPKAEKIVKVLRNFSEQWASATETYFSDNPTVKEAIDSLMANRHLIAHGRPCSISLGRVSGYFEQADQAVVFIDNLLNP